MKTWLLTLALIPLAAPAWANDLVVICKGVTNHNDMTIYVNTDARAVKMMESIGPQFERPASITEKSIEWSTDEMNHFRLDLYSGLLTDHPPNEPPTFRPATWACSTADEPKIKIK